MTTNQQWEYEDSTGVTRRGTFLHSAYTGQGPDVAYFFKRDDGTTDVISGKRLREARKVNEHERR